MCKHLFCNELWLTICHAHALFTVPTIWTGLSMGMSFLWESHGKRPMGWDRHKLLWDGNGTDKSPMDKPRVVHGNVILMGIPWETSHRMGWDRHKLLWVGMG